MFRQRKYENSLGQRGNALNSIIFHDQKNEESKEYCQFSSKNTPPRIESFHGLVEPINRYTKRTRNSRMVAEESPGPMNYDFLESAHIRNQINKCSNAATVLILRVTSRLIAYGGAATLEHLSTADVSRRSG